MKRYKETRKKANKKLLTNCCSRDIIYKVDTATAVATITVVIMIVVATMAEA